MSDADNTPGTRNSFRAWGFFGRFDLGVEGTYPVLWFVFGDPMDLVFDVLRLHLACRIPVW